MPATEKRPPSLTGRLLRGMVMPMAGVAILLGVGGAWAIEESVEAVHDRILSAATRAIGESLAVENGKITINLPKSAFAMLNEAGHHNVYYSINHEGTAMSGFADLPRVRPAPGKEGDFKYAKADYRGQHIRMVAEVHRLPGINGLVTVEVAETMEARDRVVRQMYLTLAFLEALLIGVSAILIPIAVRWGLSPLKLLRSEMDRRSASDFTPLPLAKVPSELQDFVGTFNGLLGRLDSAVRGMRRFTADASHQMRTPLSILRTHVSVLQKAKPGSEDAAASIADIGEATERLQNLLVQLLALARADGAATIKEALKPVDMVDTARHVANDLAALALKRKAKLQFTSSAEQIMALSHPVLVSELLANLIDNAIRYNARGKAVLVEVRERGGAAFVSVTDNGPGIAPEDRDKVFERFTRLHPELDKTGTGLGLSVVRALADAMGARITLGEGPSGTGLRVEVAFQPMG